MRDIAVDTATLLALFLEALFYGVFLALYIVTIFQRRKTRDVIQGRWYIPVSGAMLVLATMHLVVAFVRANRGFTVVMHTSEGMQEYFTDASVPLQVALNCIYVLQTTIGDAVLIWRLYVVYAHSLWVTCPFLVTLLANLVTGIVANCLQAKAPSGSTIFSLAYRWIETFFILTMCMNLLCTVGIMWRIRSHGHQPGGVKSALLLVAESGALYSAAVLALFIAYVKKSQGQYIAISLVVPLVGIIFVLTAFRSYFRQQVGESPAWYSHRSRGSRSLGLANLQSPSRLHGVLPFGVHQEAKAEHAMHTIAVHVARDTDTDYPLTAETNTTSSVTQDDSVEDAKTPTDAAIC